jgi:hypothetical protein
MNAEVIVALAAASMFFGMLVFSEAGRRIGTALRRRDPDGSDKGIGSAEAAVFGLLGLLVAFTFSGAATRFEARRHLVTTEANAIGTAWLRLDLVPNSAREDLRALFRQYLDLRLATYRNVRDLAATQARLAEGAALQNTIWERALASVRQPDAAASAPMLLLPALNEMFDITTTRTMATRDHPPLVIFVLLAGLSLVGAILVGFDTSESKARPWLHMLIFAGIMSVTVTVIADLEFPRLGLIRVDGADDVLRGVRASMR